MRGAFVRPDGEVRAGWRIAFFVGSSSASGILIGALVYPLLALTPLVQLAREWRVPLDELGTLAALLGGTALTLRMFEGDRPGRWARVGLHRGGLRAGPLAVAFGAGVLAILVPSLALVAVGALGFEAQPASQSWLAALVAAFTLLAPSAFVEELAARGYLLTALVGAVRVPAAVVITSLLFALAHLFNPGPTVLSTALVALAGVFLAIVRLTTGSLYAAVLAHLAWNLAQASLLHAPVSGLALPSPGYQLVDHGPAWLTGGAWGPEGGLAAALGMLVATFVFVRRRHATAQWPHAEELKGPTRITRGEQIDE